ncbi:hypothetical protein BJ912DRAFT_998243 [Pholiota molesta]|nr:hypothetical protein BJ912DRAFT_998243 [Pholiota molesta]
MPRRSTIRASNLPSLPTSSPQPPQNDPCPDDIALLRRQWQWAAFSQFFCTFSQLFAMNDVTVADIEKDLVYHTNTVIPRIMQRLLYTLSYDRKVTADNWQTALRKQYIKRDPDANPLGIEPKDPKRAKDEEEEPVAEDHEPNDPNSVNNDDMNVDHAPSPSAETSGAPVSESKQTAPDDDTELQNPVDWFDLPLLSKLETIHTLAEWQFQNPTRLRTLMKTDDEMASWRIEPIGYDSKRNAYWYIGTQDTKANATPAKRARITAPPLTPSSPVSGRHSRAAKDQAKLKLDAQARELAELNRQAAMSSISRSTRPTRQVAARAQSSKTPTRSAPPRAFGTRASARLRGPQEEEEWQPIPEEWLNEGKRGKNQKGKLPAAKTGLESDEESISDLTELSDDVGETSASASQNGKASKGNGATAIEHTTTEEPEEQAEAPQDPLKISQRIVPVAIERKREVEEALVHRKRSSRLAVREIEREEARLAAKKKQEEDEKMSRARRLEARQQKEEADRQKRELAREQRRKEREAREESRKGRTTASEEVQPEPEPEPKEPKIDESEPKPKPKPRNRSTQERRAPKTNGNNGMAKEWEVACEICQRHGMNLDDGTPMMSCGRCSKWQHISCHDSADKAAGRPLRNWDKVEFVCKSCRAQQGRPRDYYPPATQHPSTYQNNAQMQPYRSSSFYPYPSMHNSPIDVRASQYGAPYTDTAQQSYYVRPPANGQALPSQGRYPASSSSSSYPTSSYPAPVRNGTTPPMIAFSHYQPAAHGFSTSPQNAHADSRYAYDHSNQHQPYHNSGHQYNHMNQQQLPPPPQQYRTDMHPSYKAQQPSVPAWNITTPAHTPGYPVAHNNGALGSPSSAALYRAPAPAVDSQDTASPSDHAQTSYSRYPAEQYYQASQYKPHPTSYQPPLGR